MKVALYGEKKELLQKYKENIEQAFRSANEIIEIDCFSNKASVRKQSFAYDAIIMSEELMEDMIAYAKKSSERLLTLVASKQIEIFDIDKILYIEAELKCVHIVMVDGKRIMKLQLSEVEKLLDDKIFIKTHRSYIVNKNWIQSLLENEVVLKNGKKVPISRYRRKEVEEQFLRENAKEYACGS